MKTAIITILLLLVQLGSSAQNAGTIWYFGNQAGIDFSGSNPVALTNSAMTQIEGCATVSDHTGNLLFYSNGTSVWDQNHNLMANGTGLFGHQSSSQSVIIVPFPVEEGSQSTQYYIFTTNAVVNSSPSIDLYYSVVDMTLGNGLGEVVQSSKNTLLQSTVTERLHAIRHDNGRDYWVISHAWNSDDFVAFPVTPSGIGTPVLSTVGMYHGLPGHWEAGGYLRSNHKNDQLAVAIRGASVVELFDFDNTTGVVSDVVNLPIPNSELPYGIEFSPNDQLLYVSSGTSTGGSAGTGRIDQYDLSSGIGSTIDSSRTLVASSSNNDWWGAIQLAPDGMIYLAKYNATDLGRIHSPNTPGTGCNFMDNDYSLSGQLSQLGLPHTLGSNLITSLDREQITPIAEFAHIFPNPANSTLTIQIDDPGFSQMDYHLVDLRGKVLMNGKILPGNQEITLPVDHLANGLYKISLRSTSKGVQNMRFQKVN